MKTANKFHYSVFFTQTVKQERLKIALEKAFPKDRGMVFLPSMEWRGRLSLMKNGLSMWISTTEGHT